MCSNKAELMGPVSRETPLCRFFSVVVATRTRCKHLRCMFSGLFGNGDTTEHSRQFLDSFVVAQASDTRSG